MKGFSLGAVWEEMIVFLRRERALMIPVAFALLGPAQMLLDLSMTRGMSAPPTEQTARGEALLIVPALLLVLLANLTITRLALVPGISVLEALADGLRRLPRTLGTMLLMAGAFVAAALAILAAGTAGFVVFGSDPRSPAISGQLLALVTIPAFVLLVRMMLLIPVLAMEERGVLDALRRGWALGRGIVLRLAAMLLIVLVLSMMVQLIELYVVGSVIQLLALTTGAGELMKVIHMLINAAIDSLLSLGFAVYVALAYRAVAENR